MKRSPQLNKQSRKQPKIQSNSKSEFFNGVDSKNRSSKNPSNDSFCDLATFSSGLSKGFSQAITLNSYPNGISVTVHKPYGRIENKSSEHTTINDTSSSRALSCPVLYAESRGLIDPFFSRTRETRDIHVPEGKFLVYKDAIKQNLEKIFYTLKNKKQLSSTVVYLGTFTDPFHGFHKKFSQTMALMEILERYTPGRIVVQSRSRMLLTALPTLKAMPDVAHCVIPFESRLENSVSRYTPGQPRLEERLVTSAGLRAQGIKVCFSVAPILPYGETSGDTWKFAEILISYSDRVIFQSLYNGEKHEELMLRQLQLAKKLENDNQIKLLRPNAEEEVKAVIKKLSPQHLDIPAFISKEPGQLALFAA